MNQYFDICIQEAQKAYEQGDVPIGAVVVLDGKIISYAHNIREKEQAMLKLRQFLGRQSL